MITNFTKRNLANSVDGHRPQSASWKSLLTIVPWGLEGPIWSAGNSAKLDAFFATKRTIYSKHIIGSYQSAKMECAVEYESFEGFYFYLALELSSAVVRYYPRPVPVSVFNCDDCLTFRSHASDILVLMDGSKPMLFWIKSSKDAPSPEEELVYKACTAYAEKESWFFYAVRPRQLPEVLRRNVIFVSSFMEKGWENQIIDRQIMAFLYVNGESRISDVAARAVPGMSSPELMPYIFHSVVMGNIATDLLSPIDSDGNVHLPKANEMVLFDFIMEALPI